MGVSGLLGLLKSIQHPGDLKRYSGKVLGVDTYGWLHKGAISCASQLAQGKPTKRYVDYCMYRVRMLLHNGVTPYLVFDGDFLPSKAGTEATREAKREESRKRGLEFLKAGKHKQADEQFQKAIDITPAMARDVIDEAKKLGVQCIVAPYEADAQLVYLEKKGLVHGILSEDSDLLVFGAKKLITKLDRYGACIEINRSEFCRVREVSLTGWTDTEFRQMCILSGCDYLSSISGIGLKSAYRLLRKHKTPERVVQMLKFEGKSKVSENYMTEFTKAELTFIHQRVFCPINKELVLLTDDESGAAGGMPFIGAYVEPELARQIAAGEVDPITKQPLGDPSQSAARKRRALSSSSDASTAPQPQPCSIASFFNNRIPMGEMDSNCFSVDPEKVSEITNHGLAPRVFPLPRPYIASGSNTPTRSSPRRRRQTEPVNNILAQMHTGELTPTPSPSRAASTPSRHSIGPAFAGTGSQVRPKKKARLCEDDVIEEDEMSITQINQQSKFFPASTPKFKTPSATPVRGPPPPPPVFTNQTPSKKTVPQRSDKQESMRQTPVKQSPSKQTKSTTDGKEGATSEMLQSLPDLEEWYTPQKGRRSSMFKVFDDISEKAPEEGHGSPRRSPRKSPRKGDQKPMVTTPLPGATTALARRQTGRHSISMPPPPVPAFDSASTPKRVTLDEFLSSSASDSTSKPKAQGLGSQSGTSRSVSASSTPAASPMSTTRRTSFIGTPGLVSKGILSSTPRMTPLQRMGVKALGTKSSSTSPTLHKSVSLGSMKRPFWETSSRSNSRTASPSLNDITVIKMSSSQPIFANSQGSEDMLPFIDDDANNDDDETPSRRVNIDLSRFCYGS